jgi:23S rRNA pseudouridine2604 synthase
MGLIRTYGGQEAVRVNKWLAQSGVCSRREADDLIARGLVFIDGEQVTDAGRRILPGQTLRLDEVAGADLSARLTVVVHKPPGFVSAHPEPHQREASDLLTIDRLIGPGAAPEAGRSLPPVGRLDRDSRGLLLLSDDGVVAKAVIGPDGDMEKEYLVAVEGEIAEHRLDRLRHGLSLDGRRLREALVARIGRDELRIVLREGRNRQIRRMCELVGLRVVDLLRVRIGPVALGDLPEGAWRVLTGEERAALLAPPGVTTRSGGPARSRPNPR